MASIDDYLKAKLNAFTSSFSKRPLVGGLVGQGVNYVQQQAPKIAQRVNNQINSSARQQGYQNSGQLVRNLPKIVLGNSPQQFTNYVQNISDTAYKPIIGKTASNFISDTVGGLGRNMLRGPAGLTQKKSNWEKAGDLLATGGAALGPLETLGFGAFNAGVNKITGQNTRKGYQEGINTGATFAGLGKWMDTAPMISSAGKAVFNKTNSKLLSSATRIGLQGFTGGTQFGAFGAFQPAKTNKERWDNFKQQFGQGAAFSVFSSGLGEAFSGRFGRAISNGDYTTAQKIIQKLPNNSKRVRLQTALNQTIQAETAPQNIQKANIDVNTKISNRYNAPLQDSLISVRQNPDVTNPDWNKIHEYAKRELTPTEYKTYMNAKSNAKLGYLKRIETRFGNELKGLHQDQAMQTAESSITIPKAKTNKQVAEQAVLPVSKPRGFTESVQEAPNVSLKVKENVISGYKQKPNSKLMGEAEALLHEGVKLNIKNVKNIDQKVAATIQEAINQQRENPQVAANLFNNLSEQGTELGRGVQAYSLLKQMTPESIALSAAGKIKKYNMTATRPIPELTGEQVKLIADKVDALSSLKVGSREHNIAVNELSNVINEFIPSSLVDKAVTVWKAGLLTSLRTHERNLLGNTIMSGAEVAKDVFASPVDRLMALKTGRRTLTLNTEGTGAGVKRGLIAAKDIVQKGYDPEETISKFDQKHITWGDNPLEKALKKGTDAVFRTLGGEDKPFLHGATARSLFDQAKTEAINVGRKGDIKLIEKLVANPTEEMIKIAQIDANYATFHDKTMLGTIANGIKRVASDSTYGKWGKFGQAVTEILAPFTGVPSSIVGKTIDYSPIGLAKGTVNVGRVLAGQVPELQRQAAQEMGRGILGTGLFGLGAYLMSRGVMTGQPKDTKEADQWAIEGKQANSVLIDGKWRSINSIGPQNLVMLAGAKYQEEKQKIDGSIGAYASALAKDQLSQTFLQGVQGPLNAISDPKRFGQSYVGNQIASLVPNIIKDTSKALDPYQREANSIGDYVKNSIPLVRNQSTPKRDVLGNAMVQEPTGINAYLDLFNSKTPISNGVVNELGRLNNGGFNATPSKLSKTQTIQGEKISLTPEQLDSLEKFRGPVLSQALDQLFQTPSYQSKSDQAKADAVDAVVLKVNKYMRGETGAPTFNGGQSAQPADTAKLIEPKATKTLKPKATTKTVKTAKAKKPKKVKVQKLKKIPLAKFKAFKNPKLKASKQIKFKKIKKAKIKNYSLKSLKVKG